MQHQQDQQNIVACSDLLSQSLTSSQSILSDELCRSISNRNGELSPKDVKVTLLNGRPVYTLSKKYYIS